MDIRKIKKLIDLMMDSDLQALEVREGDQAISITRRLPAPAFDGHLMPAAPVNSALTIDTPSGRLETAPMVGVFYAASAPGEPPFVTVGQRVRRGEVIGIIEAMKIMNPIEASEDGEVVELLVKNSEVVQYGQPLMRLR